MDDRSSTDTQSRNNDLGRDLLITVQNLSPDTPKQPTTSQSIALLLEIPELMTEYDQESMMDKKKQSKALRHISALTKLINKNIYRQFAQILWTEGFNKED